VPLAATYDKKGTNAGRKDKTTSKRKQKPHKTTKQDKGGWGAAGRRSRPKGQRGGSRADLYSPPHCWTTRKEQTQHPARPACI